MLSVFALALAAIFAPSAFADTGEGRYIVVFKDSVSHPGALAADQAEEVDAEVDLVYRTALKGYAAVLPDDEVATLEADPRVDYVTPDRKVSIASQNTPTGISRVFAPGNETLAINEADDVRVDADVAVIDTGVDFEHPDLNVTNRTNCVGASPTVACADGTGTDGYGHGTHVAGTIGALDNGEGVVGVAPGARIWSVRVLNNAGYGFESWFIAGVDWVTVHSGDIEVANMSLTCECSPAIEEAISTSVKAGVVYVVAAGNDSVNVSTSSLAKNPDVITVSALADYNGKAGGLGGATCKSYGPDDTLASFSNFGAGVDVAAPGTCILSTVPGGEYAELSGTSMATPHVAGAAAILAMQDKPTSKADVEAIRSTIVGAGNSGWTDTSPDGIKEPLLDVSNESVFEVPESPRARTGEATEITGYGATLTGFVNPNGHETEYQFEYGYSRSYLASVPVSMASAGSGESEVEVSVPIELEGNMTYHYRLVAINAEGISRGNDMQLHTPFAKLPTFSFAFGSQGMGEGQFEFPGGVTVDGEGNVLVADVHGHRIQKFNPAGEYLSEFGSFGSEPGQFKYPADVAVDPSGNIWVTDANNSRIQEFDSEGEFIRQVGSFGYGNGQFSTPFGIATDTNGNIWVADLNNSRIQQFDSEGNHLQTVSGILRPIDLAADHEGNVWVTSGLYKVQQFDENGGFIREIGGYGSGEGGFKETSGIAIDSEGNLWVADGAGDRIQKFDEAGGFLLQFGESGSGEGQFDFAPGPILAFDQEDSLWVTDTYNRRIQKWVPGS